MSENKKVLLSLKDVEVKFNVRGRILTAIRGVSLDIYENESLAIVGESGSGKSVLTKTFTGMLESNGFISKGSIIYQDDLLSSLQCTLTKREIRRYHHLVKFLNQQAAYLGGKDDYLQILEEKKALKRMISLTPEQKEDFSTRKKDLTFERVELYNKKIAAETSKEKKEIALEIKKKDKEISQLKKERRQVLKEKRNKVFKDKDFMLAYKNKIQSLKQHYLEKVSISSVSEEIKRQNRLIAKEILLSIERYSPVTQFFYLNSLKDRFSEAYKKGLEMTEETIEKLYELITFRVIFKGVENEYFNALNDQEVQEFKQKNLELLKDQSENYEMIQSFVNSIQGNEKLVYFIAQKVVENPQTDLTTILYDSYEEAIMIPNTIMKGYTILDLTKIKTATDWQKIRGSRIATVFQDPMTSLNPIVTIGKQITEVIMKHQNCSAAEAEKRAIYMMERVGIPDAAKRFKEYPFQYSGGMRQRIVIAIALSCQPKVLICDEPTTALDVTIQAQIIDLIKDLQKEFQFTTIYITHDLGVVASVADRVVVLYAGQIVEAGKVEEIFYDPKHPYTWALLSSLPQLATKGKELFSIQGTPPSLYNVIKGDAFAERNPFCLAVDLQYDAPYFYVSDTHFAKTWLLDPRAPKIEKPEIIQNIHEKLEKTLTQFSKEEYEYVRYNKQRSHLVDTEYRHRLSKR